MNIYIMLCTLIIIWGKIDNYLYTSMQSVIVEKKEKLLPNMVYIKGGHFTMGNHMVWPIKRAKDDSTLLATLVPSHHTVESFYLNATEVTNSEWREFVNDKSLELGKSRARLEFSPDTCVWVKEFSNAQLTRTYYSSRQFNNYPVVGINWTQANSYCKWKTKKINAIINKYQINDSVVIRLPTEIEWEYAAQHRPEEKRKSKELVVSMPIHYTWPNSQPIIKINELCNIGAIHDENGILIKDYDDDGCDYTCEVASFPSNSQGLFDMAGNVSEWTSDRGSVYSLGKELYSKLDIQEHIQNIEQDTNLGQSEIFLPPHNSEEMQSIISQLKDDQNILGNFDTKICKGGTWANGVIYCQTATRQVYDKSEASSKLGFRVAMSVPNKNILKYLGKKK